MSGFRFLYFSNLCQSPKHKISMFVFILVTIKSQLGLSNSFMFEQKQKKKKTKNLRAVNNNWLEVIFVPFEFFLKLPTPYFMLTYTQEVRDTWKNLELSHSWWQEALCIIFLLSLTVSNAFTGFFVWLFTSFGRKEFASWPEGMHST